MNPMSRFAVLAIPSLAFALLASAGTARADGDGEAVFKKNCAICHTIEAGKNKLGPSLAGVVGRKAGSIDGFNYSPANKNSGLTWDEATLDVYLTDPKAKVPGTKMTFAGLKDAGDRKAIIEYLKAH
jgi:cytochrome c2